MNESEKSVPLAISLPETLIAQIDHVAADVKDSRSGVMRRAIREGLPLVKLGGKSDALTLDSELSAEVDEAAKETELNRNKVLLESIRIGLKAFASWKTSEKMSLAELKEPKERELIIRAVEDSFKLYDDPMTREHRIAIAQRGKVSFRLDDLIKHVPEAKRRFDLMNRLTKIRNAPGGPGGGTPVGLNTHELEWQIGMSEKYGAHPALWPEDEKRTHNVQYEIGGEAANKSNEISTSQKSKKTRK